MSSLLIGMNDHVAAATTLATFGTVKAAIDQAMKPVITSAQAMVPAGLELTSVSAQEQITENVQDCLQQHTIGSFIAEEMNTFFSEYNLAVMGNEVGNMLKFM